MITGRLLIFGLPRMRSRIWKPSASGSDTSSSTRSGSGGLLNSALISARFFAKRVRKPALASTSPTSVGERLVVLDDEDRMALAVARRDALAGVARHGHVEAGLGELRAAGGRFLAGARDLLGRRRAARASAGLGEVQVVVGVGMRVIACPPLCLPRLLLADAALLAPQELADVGAVPQRRAPRSSPPPPPSTGPGPSEVPRRHGRHDGRHDRRERRIPA